MKKVLLNLVFLFALVCFAEAQEFKVADIFSDNMVLQQKINNPFWGWGKPGTKVTISTSWNPDKEYTGVVNSKGTWKIAVPTPAAGGPYEVTVTANKKKVFQNVFVGEVWLASGQSNMSMPLKGYYCQPVLGATEAILSSAKKQIHFINIPTLAAYKPLEHFDAGWVKASPENVAECTAVGWFFADFLQRNIDVPVGIINASYGGSNIEAWMNAEACKQFDDIPVPPLSDETSPWISNVPTVLYNGMIHPLVGYGIKGIIWYQGESNIFNVLRYAPSVAAMVSKWREAWGLGEIPFYYAQIAPYDYKEWNFFTPQWPEVSAYQREAQRQCLTLIPNSAMAVLLDVGERYLIHPRRKKEVGDRLGMLALSKTYGMKGFEAESPTFSKMEVEGNKAIIHFDNQFNGLTSYGKTLELFEISGDNKVFHKADAYIDEEKGTVVVTCKYVAEPKAVRYAFKDFVKAELFGTGGLPVSSFRTDDWD